VPISPQDSDVFARLESAIAAWNARVGGMHEELGHTIALAREKLEIAGRVLNARRTLSTTLVVARARLDALNQDPAEREAAVNTAVERVSQLGGGLTEFQHELERLHHHARRIIDTGAVLTEQLFALHHGKDAPAPQAPPAAAADTVAPAVSERERKLAVQVEALRADLAEVRAQLAVAQALAATAEAPGPSQENEALRSDVTRLQADLQAAQERARRMEAAAAATEAAWRGQVEALRAECTLLREQLHSSKPPGTRPMQAEEELAQLTEELAAPGMQSAPTADSQAKRRLGEILVATGVLTLQELDIALQAQQAGPHRHLGVILVDRGLADEEAIARALARQVQRPFVQLRSQAISPQVLALISPQLARRHRCIPLRAEGPRLLVAMVNPFDLVAIENLQIAASRHVDPVVATPGAIREALRKYYQV